MASMLGIYSSFETQQILYLTCVPLFFALDLFHFFFFHWTCVPLFFSYPHDNYSGFSCVKKNSGNTNLPVEHLLTMNQCAYVPQMVNRNQQMWNNRALRKVVSNKPLQQRKRRQTKKPADGQWGKGEENL